MYRQVVKMRKRKCRICEKLYPTKVEDDYSGECSSCEDLSFEEQSILQKKIRGY